MTVIEFTALNVGLVVCRACHVAVPEDRTDGHAEWHAEQENSAAIVLGRLVEIDTRMLPAPLRPYADPDDSGSAFSSTPAVLDDDEVGFGPVDRQRVDVAAHGKSIGVNLQIETNVPGTVRVRLDGDLPDLLDALALFGSKHIHLDNLTEARARPGGGAFLQGTLDIAEWRRFAIAQTRRVENLDIAPDGESYGG